MREITRILGESEGLTLMVLPQLPVKVGLLVAVELVLSTPVQPPAPHPINFGITALETYGKTLTQTSGRPIN